MCALTKKIIGFDCLVISFSHICVKNGWPADISHWSNARSNSNVDLGQNMTLNIDSHKILDIRSKSKKIDIIVSSESRPGREPGMTPATQISRVVIPFFTFYKTQPFYTDKERVSERKSFNYGCLGIVTIFSPFLKDRYMLFKNKENEPPHFRVKYYSCTVLVECFLSLGIVQRSSGNH